MRQRFLILAMALLCVLALPAAARAADDPGAKIDASVETVLGATGGDTAIPVIVYTAGDPGMVQTQLPQVVDVLSLPEIGAAAAYLTADEITRLAACDFVDVIVADNPVYGFDYRSSMDVTNLAIGLAEVPAPRDGGPTGEGVTVAVLDSGIATTTDLAASRIVGWKDFVHGKKRPYDDAGHGTFVAGLVAGDGTASLPLEDGGLANVQYRGVAPGADLVGIKILDETGQGRASAVVAGVAWAIAHRDEYGIRVLNLSIGGNPVGPIEADPLARAVEAAWKAGIVVVCAAGNEGDFGSGGVLSPGNDPYVITVGASDTQQTARLGDDAVAKYSSWGPTLWDEYAKPDVVAPGNRLVSLRAPGSYIDRKFPDNVVAVADYAPDAPEGTAPSYLRLSGTSTSAPVAAGAVALILDEDPGLSPDDVKVRLMRTADPLPGAVAYQQGAGLIDVDEALADATHATGPALSPDLGDGTTVLTADTYAQWEQRTWSKYGWTKFKWTKFKWTKFKWTKFKWTKFKWTSYEWTKFKWTVLIEGQ